MRRIVPLFGRPFVAAVFVAVIVGARAGEAMGQISDVPELKAFDRWVGDWTFDVSHEKTKLQPEGLHFTGTGTVRRTLKNRWLEIKMEGGIFEAMALVTFDPQRRAYRMWSHTSEGETSEFVGTWDAASKTVTWKPMSAGGLTAPGTVKVVEGDRIEWELVLKDASGAVVLHQRIKASRRK
jgi:hypothetical protein